MRNCCCCIPVVVGAGILGVIGALVTISELVVTGAYLADSQGFNPIRKNINGFYYILQKTLSDQENLDADEVSDIMERIRSYTRDAILIETVISGVYCLACLLLLCGLYWRKRALLLPYLFLSLVIAISLILSSFLATAVSFFSNPFHGGAALVVTLVVTFISLYLWVVVQRAYLHLGRADYAYSPAPTKSRDEYYPTAPQLFQMSEPDKRL